MKNIIKTDSLILYVDTKEIVAVKAKDSDYHIQVEIIFKNGHSTEFQLLDKSELEDIIKKLTF